MELSSPKFKALAVSAGMTFWFFIITNAIGIFSLEILSIFVIVVFPVMQIISLKLSYVLDVFAIYNTKFFLGILFVTLISLYGIFFKVLRIDLLRLKYQKQSYWLKMDQSMSSRFFKQY